MSRRSRIEPGAQGRIELLRGLEVADVTDARRHERAIARNPTGWDVRMDVANRSTDSGCGAVVNIVGSSVSTKSVGAGSEWIATDGNRTLCLADLGSMPRTC
jgi:hypothetical protein